MARGIVSVSVQQTSIFSNQCWFRVTQFHAKQTLTPYVFKQDSLNCPQLPKPVHTQFFVHTHRIDTLRRNKSSSLPSLLSNF